MSKALHKQIKIIKIIIHSENEHLKISEFGSTQQLHTLQTPQFLW